MIDDNPMFLDDDDEPYEDSEEDTEFDGEEPDLLDLLYKAAESGDIYGIEQALLLGADVNDSYLGLTAMGNAIAGHQIEAVNFLISRGADLGNLNEWLYDAVESDWREGVDFMLDRGANLQVCNQFGETLVHVAAGSAGPVLLNYLMERGLSPLTPDDTGSFPLHAAAEEANWRVVEALLAAGLPVDATQREDLRTPLHIAADRQPDGDEDDLLIIRALCEHGANVMARDRDQTTPLHVAATVGDANCVKELLKWGAKTEAREGLAASTPLVTAALFLHPEAVEVLVSVGADVNYRNDNGITPLNVGSRNAAITRLLLDAGADVSGMSGSDSLETAASWGCEEAVRMLVDAGIPINVRDEEGKTAEEVARAEGHLAVSEYLRRLREANQ